MLELLSVIAAVATAVQIVVLIVLHRLPTGYNPVRDALSDYGVGQYRAVFWAQVVAGAVARLALAIALTRSHPSTPALVVVMLLVAAAAFFLMPWFATDQGGGRFQTRTGTIHMVLAISAFTAVTVAASSLAGAVRHAPAWHGVANLLVILSWGLTATAIAVGLAVLIPRLRPVFGLIERLFSITSIVWFLVVAIELARLAT